LSSLSLSLLLSLSFPRSSSDGGSWFSESSFAGTGIENSHLLPVSLSVIAVVLSRCSFRWDITRGFVSPTALMLIGSGR